RTGGPRATSRARWSGSASGRECRLDIGELALQRLVLGLEQLIGHVGPLEHREAEGRAAVGQRHYPGGEDRHLVLGGAGEHVDHAGLGVGLDLEVELAEAVDDLVVLALALELSRELGRPLRELLDRKSTRLNSS